MTTVTRIVAAAALATALSACATITRGTTQEFTVESTPPGAEVKTSNGFTCEATPCAFKAPRKDAFEVTVSKDGYKEAKSAVIPRISSGGTVALIGNIFIGGIIGIVVDVVTGAMNDLTPNPVQVTLDSVEMAGQTATPASEPAAESSEEPALEAQPAG